MTFLPIVERELRVAARKRSTFWLRIAASLIAVLLGVFFMILGGTGAGPLPRLGGALFDLLTWTAVFVALSAGVFFTSDSLSEEKREGTLGFLFLTDLRGYDVVLGKLLATSLRALFALLAVIPILAITLLMGGVTGGQFWRAAFALVNALVASLAAGMLISALSRDPQRAMSGTLLLLLLLIAGAPLADWLISELSHRPFVLLRLTSPLEVFRMATGWGHPPFFRGLFLSLALTVCWLALASALVPRTWQQRASRKKSALAANRSYAWRYGGTRRRSGLRERLLGHNPVLWLACRERWQAVGIWILAIVVLALFLLAAVLSEFTGFGEDLWPFLSFLSAVLNLLLYLWAASQANRFFLEARKSGLIELLLATPLTVKEIVQGQWRALLRLFAWPVGIMLGTQLLFLGLASLGAWQRSAAGTRMFSAGFGLAGAIASFVTTCANLLTLLWFGMWAGMTSKSANLATLKTLLLAQILPWFGISLLGGVASAALVYAMSPAGVSGFTQLLAVACPTLLTILKAFGFITWSRNKLHSSFRERAVRGWGQKQMVTRTPPPIPASRVPPATPENLASK